MLLSTTHDTSSLVAVPTPQLISSCSSMQMSSHGPASHALQTLCAHFPCRVHCIMTMCIYLTVMSIPCPSLLLKPASWPVNIASEWNCKPGDTVVLLMPQQLCHETAEGATSTHTRLSASVVPTLTHADMTLHVCPVLTIHGRQYHCSSAHVAGRVPL